MNRKAKVRAWRREIAKQVAHNEGLRQGRAEVLRWLRAGPGSDAGYYADMYTAEHPDLLPRCDHQWEPMEYSPGWDRCAICLLTERAAEHPTTLAFARASASS